MSATPQISREKVEQLHADPSFVEHWSNEQIRALCALARQALDGQQDTERLDAIERFTLAVHGEDALGEAVVEFTGPSSAHDDDCEDDESCECSSENEWTVVGPQEFGGWALGQGASLRAAIDHAMSLDAARLTEARPHE